MRFPRSQKSLYEFRVYLNHPRLLDPADGSIVCPKPVAFHDVNGNRFTARGIICDPYTGPIQGGFLPHVADFSCTHPGENLTADRKKMPRSCSKTSRSSRVIGFHCLFAGPWVPLRGEQLARRVPLPLRRSRVSLAQESRLVRRVPLPLCRSMGSPPWGTVSPSGFTASSQTPGFSCSGERVSPSGSTASSQIPGPLAQGSC